MNASPIADMTDLGANYQPVAIYLEDADSVEYLRRDAPRVYRRVDSFLTLVLDMKTRDLTGFRLKGFRNFFLNHLKMKSQLLDDDFIPLVSAIEDVVKLIGDELTRDLGRKEAYRQAKLMAHQDSVSIEPLAA
jgi:hypothetical protein